MLDEGKAKLYAPQVPYQAGSDRNEVCRPCQSSAAFHVYKPELLRYDLVDPRAYGVPVEGKVVLDSRELPGPCDSCYLRCLEAHSVHLTRKYLLLTSQSGHGTARCPAVHRALWALSRQKVRC